MDGTLAQRAPHCSTCGVVVPRIAWAQAGTYLHNTHAKTHDAYTLEVLDVFSAVREGEDARFAPHADLHNRRLLWHGSRLSNWVGILSQVRGKCSRSCCASGVLSHSCWRHLFTCAGASHCAAGSSRHRVHVRQGRLLRGALITRRSRSAPVCLRGTHLCACAGRHDGTAAGHVLEECQLLYVNVDGGAAAAPQCSLLTWFVLATGFTSSDSPTGVMLLCEVALGAYPHLLWLLCNHGLTATFYVLCVCAHTCGGGLAGDMYERTTSEYVAWLIAVPPASAPC